jgi:broad specificity phosphatase PhoE
MTGFWLIRHALVEENARAFLYGTDDVALCETTLAAQQPYYLSLAAALPQNADWIVTPLSRTVRTAANLIAAGHQAAQPTVEPDLIEQNLGTWQGLPHAALPEKLTHPAHPFWPLAGAERPPGGESFSAVITRVGATLERLAEERPGREIIVVSHGGAIRAAVAHALRIDADNALHLSIFNLSLTRLERVADGWRVVCVNTMLA